MSECPIHQVNSYSCGDFKLSTFVKVVTLTDASQFLSDAKGLPDTLSGRRRCSTYLRAVILFSWVAVEEVIKERIHYYSRLGAPHPPTKLYDKAVYVLAVRTAFGRSNWWDELVGDKYIIDINTATSFEPQKFAHLTACATNALPKAWFRQYRDLRNEVAHINELGFLPTVSQAKECLEFCKQLISKLESPVLDC